MNDAYTDEIEIDLVNMVFYFLKKWRSLIAVVLVFALLGGAWAMLPPTDLDPEKIKEDIYTNMEKAAEYRNLYELKKQYNQESLVMQMDANGLYQGRLSYHVSAERELNMVRAEYNALVNDDLRILIREASGYDADLKYIAELVGWSAEITTDGRGDNSNATLNVSYSVTTDDEEKTIAMLDVIRQAVQDLQKELTRRYGDYSSVKISDMVLPVSGSGFIQTQDSNNAAMFNYLEAAMSLEESFSDDELRYYTLNLLKEEPEELGLGHYAKKIIILAVLGGVLWVCWFLVKYLMDRSIKTVDEAETASRLFLLGRVKGEKNLKGIDKWVGGFQEKTRPTLNETSYVAAVIDSRKSGEAVLCGNRNAEEVCRIMGELGQGCGGLIPCDFTFASAEALKKAKDVGQAILVVRIGKTKKAELLREMDLCKMQGVSILGMVVVD